MCQRASGGGTQSRSLRHDGLMDPLGGQLLVANAGLFDPNFRRSVVLVGHHDDEGAVGVVLNHVTDVAVDEAVPPLAELVVPGDPLFVGGPVQPEAAVVLAEFEDRTAAGIIAFGSVGFLPDEADADNLAGIRRARVFAGYTGWGPGQLEDEVVENSWIVAPATAEDVFHADPDQLWADVLRRLGPRYDLLRTMPVDPSLN
jgi:putative transcriptional regulator